MELSPQGIDTVELKKRYNQHKADIEHVNKSVYLDFDEKCFQIRKIKSNFFKSLRRNELDFISKLAMGDM